jgi:hypothetical protein
LDLKCFILYSKISIKLYYFRDKTEELTRECSELKELNKSLADRVKSLESAVEVNSHIIETH